jgi:UDP-perosamine 4-acetyltransferase
LKNKLNDGAKRSGPERRILLLGAGGHASVLHDMLLALGLPPHGVIDRKLNAGDLWEGLPVLGDDDLLSTLSSEEYVLVNGLGASPDCAPRNALYARFAGEGFSFLSLAHPSAVLAHNVALGDGCQIMAGAVLQSGVEVRENSVVNTRASIDHHCRIRPGAFISPGAVLCGGVAVGNGVFIGAGAILLPGVQVGDQSVIGAGAVVLRDVPKDTIAVGNPARDCVYP